MEGLQSMPELNGQVGHLAAREMRQPFQPFRVAEIAQVNRSISCNALCCWMIVGLFKIQTAMVLSRRK